MSPVQASRSSTTRSKLRPTVGHVRVADVHPVAEQAHEAVKSFVRRSTAGLRGCAARLERRVTAVSGLAVDRESKLGRREERMQRRPAAVGQLDRVRRMVADPATDRDVVAGERTS